MSRASDWEFFLIDHATAPDLPRVPPRLRAYAVMRTARTLYAFRRHGWTTAQLVLRVVLPDGLCLPRSLTLATYLSALGLPAEMTIARALSTSVPKNSFHSWTELYGTVLNGNPDVQLGYRVLQRISAQAPANRA
ncbi:lasso peptide biosynthesis protein [Nonomuraea typhae]|uniref:Lasso peptide biosynthesis protein n=1 Tax=Nonomuraea typhae TaxID=2603600 RepID=A0ABW7Z7R0_9ACTN